LVIIISREDNKEVQKTKNKKTKSTENKKYKELNEYCPLKPEKISRLDQGPCPESF